MFRQIFPLIRRCGQNFACRNRSINGKRTYMLTPWFSPSNPFKSLERQIREMERHFENFFGYCFKIFSAAFVAACFHQLIFRSFRSWYLE